MNNILKLVEQRIAVIKQVICEQEAALSKAPEGTLNIAGSKDNPYYYYKKTSVTTLQNITPIRVSAYAQKQRF